MLRQTLAAAAVLLPLAALPAPDASAASRSQALYSVTFKASMSERWTFREEYGDDCNLTGAMCTRDETGEGTAKLDLRTRRPADTLVMRGFGGRSPNLNVGTGEGYPLTGPSLRSGLLKTVYGGPWTAGNPNREAETGDCGNRTVTGTVNLAWRGRNKLAPLLVSDEDRENCPTGPSTSFDWQGGDGPSLDEVVAQASEKKFLGTKQFTVGASRSWTGTVEPINRSSRQGWYRRDGQKTVTWSWSATFRLKSDRRRRR